MSAEPLLDRAAFLAWLGRTYDVALDHLEFLPLGTTPAYRAVGPERRLFVKLVQSTPFGKMLLGRLEAEGPLLQALRRHRVLNRVPKVVSSKAGRTLERFEDVTVLAYEWIDARPLGEQWSNTLDELAGLLGRLHAASDVLTAVVPRFPTPPEDFALPFEADLRLDLDRLRRGQLSERRGSRALRVLLRPMERHLTRLFEQARAFAEQARSHSNAFVVCHTDAHGGNVLRDANGDLWLIDWETARLAPREHDLWMLHDGLREVLPAYEAALGRRVTPHGGTLGFYLYRRVLEDLAVDVRAIVRENTRDEEDEVNLGVLERFVLPAARRVEGDFARLRESLPRR
ncbi:phosphotransferase enzyme family protein [Deinococcus yavapaiensis]|uniref:Phosphotransferase family enzyme n=1 Tax=Deinococcus yavapaiensis KR-236 TaxID=694435 RepID=A0A318S5P9_9DEIO|nr:aminoglycoside phosphotransferase family protein [Deinococcus yavapaiensis]PYE48989.1 phosphotransferase family enzyme [Deinococcus yavapaiensis KR-236]